MPTINRRHHVLKIQTLRTYGTLKLCVILGCYKHLIPTGLLEVAFMRSEKPLKNQRKSALTSSNICGENYSYRHLVPTRLLAVDNLENQRKSA